MRQFLCIWYWVNVGFGTVLFSLTGWVSVLGGESSYKAYAIAAVFFLQAIAIKPTPAAGTEGC